MPVTTKPRKQGLLEVNNYFSARIQAFAMAFRFKRTEMQHLMWRINYQRLNVFFPWKPLKKALAKNSSEHWRKCHQNRKQEKRK